MASMRILPIQRLSNLVWKQYKPFVTNTPLTRLSRSASSLDEKGDGDDPNKLHWLSFNVNRFGDLSIKNIAHCNFCVGRVNPELNPDQNTAFVELPEGVPLKVDYRESSLSLRGQDPQERGSESYQPSCNIAVPIKYNVDVCVSGRSNVKVKDLQNEHIMVKCQSGDCLLSDIQSNDVSVTTSGGSIASEGLLHSNAVLRTQQNGGVTLNKILCQQLDVSTDGGSIDVKSLYAVESKFANNAGRIHIGNAHRNVNIDIRSQGKLIIDSLDGNLVASVNVGDVEVFVIRLNGINIQVQSGDIVLKLSTVLDAHLDLKGSSVAIDDLIQMSDTTRTSADGIVSISGNLLQEGITDPPTIQAHTKKGSVNVQIQSWVDSLNLGNYVDTDSE